MSILLREKKGRYKLVTVSVGGPGQTRVASKLATCMDRFGEGPGGSGVWAGRGDGGKVVAVELHNQHKCCSGVTRLSSILIHIRCKSLNLAWKYSKMDMW